jgi:hypothetical protein
LGREWIWYIFQQFTATFKKIYIKFANGKLAAGKIISQFASISAGDEEKLMEMYATFNFCSNTTSKQSRAYFLNPNNEM